MFRKGIITFFLACLFLAATAQYIQPNNFKSPIEEVFPKQVFDPVAAKNALAPGTATMTGLLFTKKGIVGESFKKIYLFPATPYFKEWYELKKRGVQVKKGMIRVATMDSVAAGYSYWCQTNIEGEFSFPNLKPGKYILYVTVDKVATRSFDRYKGSGYNSDGGQTDYYSRENYSTSYKDDLIKEVEIPQGEEVVSVKWKIN